MPQLINVPGMGTVSFPDGMSDADISNAIQKNLPTSNNSAPKSSMPDDTNVAQKALIGLGSGFMKVGEGAKQLALTAGEKLGLVPQGAAQQYTQSVDQEHAAYDKTPVAQSTVGKVGEFAGQNLPFLAIPGGVAGKLGARMLTGALSGAGIGASQYVPEGDSRLFDTAAGFLGGLGLPPLASGLLSKNPYVKAGTGAALGGLLGYSATGSPYESAGTAGMGALAPFVPSLAANTARNIGAKLKGLLSGDTAAVTNPVQQTIKPAVVMNSLQGVDPDQAIAAKQAADRLGLNITPAEASGSPIAASAQGKLGTSKEGALMLHDFGQTRQEQQKNIIRNFLDDVTPDNTNASNDIRTAAQQVLNKKDMALASAAKPLYQEAYKSQLPTDTFQALAKDPVIQQSLKKVTSDPIYQRELANTPQNSVKTLDYVKRNIDDQIDSAMRAGEKNKARLLMGAKNQLLTELDKASPTYAAARGLYSAEAPAVAQLKNSNIGKIANLSDLQLKNVTKIIFDPGQTDPKVLGQLRDEISTQAPDAWRSIIRNHLESGMDKAGDYAGSTFFKNFLQSDRNFNQLLTATKDMPNVQSKLLDMRTAFKNLINPVTPQTAARLAKSSLDVPRSTYEAVSNHVKNLLGGQYDQAAIKFITSNQWDKEFNTISKIKDKNVRAARIGALLGKINASVTPNAINSTAPTQENQ